MAKAEKASSKAEQANAPTTSEPGVSKRASKAKGKASSAAPSDAAGSHGESSGERGPFAAPTAGTGALPGWLSERLVHAVDVAAWGQQQWNGAVPAWVKGVDSHLSAQELRYVRSE